MSCMLSGQRPLGVFKHLSLVKALERAYRKLETFTLSRIKITQSEQNEQCIDRVHCLS